jgi:hypothetical protein
MRPNPSILLSRYAVTPATGLPKRRRNTLRYNNKISRTPFGHQAELEGTHSQETETDGSPLQGTSLATWTVIPPVSQQ